jgi:hypothetical protein
LNQSWRQIPTVTASPILGSKVNWLFLSWDIKKLETVKPKSLVSTDIRLYQSIIKSLEAAMPQLNMLPI